MQKATRLSVATTTIFYMLCGCMGYAAFGDAAPDNLLTGFGFYEPFWLLDVANVAIVVPVGFLGALAFPRLRWQDWAAYAFVGALAIELTQGVLLPDRQMSATDVVANTVGALLGALVASPFRLPRRPARV